MVLPLLCTGSVTLDFGPFLIFLPFNFLPCLPLWSLLGSVELHVLSPCLDRLGYTIASWPEARGLTGSTGEMWKEALRREPLDCQVSARRLPWPPLASPLSLSPQSSSTQPCCHMGTGACLPCPQSCPLLLTRPRPQQRSSSLLLHSP